MAILQPPLPIVGQNDVVPNYKSMAVSDSYDQLVSPGFLNSSNLQGYPVSNTDILCITYDYNINTGRGTLGLFQPVIVGGVITLFNIFSNSDIIQPFVSGLGLEWQDNSNILINPGSCFDVGFNSILQVNSQLTINRLIVGVGGIDTGSIDIHTPYAIYVIGNNDDPSVVNAIYSLNHEEPVYPPGYDISKRIGRCNTDGGGFFNWFNMIPPFTSTTRLYNFSNILILSGSGTGSYVDISLSEVIGTSDNFANPIPIELNVTATAIANTTTSGWNINFKNTNTPSFIKRIGDKNVSATQVIPYISTVSNLTTALLADNSYGFQLLGTNNAAGAIAWSVSLGGFTDYI